MREVLIFLTTLGSGTGGSTLRDGAGGRVTFDGGSVVGGNTGARGITTVFLGTTIVSVDGAACWDGIVGIGGTV